MHGAVAQGIVGQKRSAVHCWTGKRILGLLVQGGAFYLLVSTNHFQF